MRQLFDDMDEKSKKFYTRVFNTCVLNLHACRRGYFDTLICETDDPAVMHRWRLAVPQIVRLVKIDNEASGV